MRLSSRLWLVLLVGSGGCQGGPVSDWPFAGDDDAPEGPGVEVDDGDRTNAPVTPPTPGRTPSSGGSGSVMDAGAAPPPAQDDALDAGAPDAGERCAEGDASDCSERCEGEPDQAHRARCIVDL